MYIHDEFRKPYQCPECSYDFVKRDRFRNHLLRCHNIEYNDAVHGYKEVPNMNETVTECLKVQYPGTGPINNTLEKISNSVLSIQ
jgi:ribosomal protein L37AE/L43A